MALINLSYHNIIVQNAVNALRFEDQRTAVAVILEVVSSPSFDIRKAAIFCLDNLVTSHRQNAKLLADAGGVLNLVALLNDDEDDEISKSFPNVDKHGDIAMAVILGHVAALSYGVESVKGIGSGLNQQQGMPEMAQKALEEVAIIANKNQDYYMKLDNNAGAGIKTSDWEDGTDFTHVNGDSVGGSSVPVTKTEIVWGMLGKLLPVINGIVYNDASAAKYLWTEASGIPILLHVMTRSLPLDLRIVVSYIIANVTQNGGGQLQALAAEMGIVLDVFNAFLAEIDLSNDSDGEDSANRASEGFTIVFTVLNNIFQNNIANVREILKPEYEHTLLSILKCCRQNLNTELRNDAARVPLTIAEVAIQENLELRKHLLDSNVDAEVALQLLAESFDSSLSVYIKQRAEKCFRALSDKDSKK